jgi:hypothetical protein
MLRWLAVFVLLTMGTAQAATIEKYLFEPDLVAKWGEYAITVEGQFVDGDYQKFKLLAEAAPKDTIVAFDSPGGHMATGLQMGMLIRDKGLRTLVIAHKTCSSACAMAWLGGVVRSADHTARIGYHAAYSKVDGQITGDGNAVAGAYINKIGLPIRAIVYITRKRPNEMQWLTPKDAEDNGIAVTWWTPTNKEDKPIEARPAPPPQKSRSLAELMEREMAGFVSLHRSAWSSPHANWTNWSTMRKFYGDQVLYPRSK